MHGLKNFITHTTCKTSTCGIALCVLRTSADTPCCACWELFWGVHWETPDPFCLSRVWLASCPMLLRGLLGNAGQNIPPPYVAVEVQEWNMIGLAFKILSNNQLKRFSCIITFSLNGRGRQNQNCKNLTFINSSNEYRYSSCIYIYFHETQLAIKTIVMTNHGCLLHLELILKHKETNKKFRKPYRQPPGSSSGNGA